MFLYTQKFHQVAGANNAPRNNQAGGAQNTQTAQNRQNTQSTQAAFGGAINYAQSNKTDFTSDLKAMGASDATIASMDTSKDGLISKSELGAADPTKDGKFDSKDLVSFVENMKKQEQAQKPAGQEGEGKKCGGGPKAGEAQKAEEAGSGNAEEELIKKLMEMGLTKEQATALVKAMKKDPALAKKVEEMIKNGDTKGLKAEAQKAEKAEKSSTTAQSTQYTPPVDRAQSSTPVSTDTTRIAA